MTGWDGGDVHQDLKHWEGSKFGHADLEMSGGVYLVGPVNWRFFSKLMVVEVSVRVIPSG